MTATLRQIVDDALQYVGEVAGVGVEQYSEDRMRADAIRGFNMLFKKRHWEQFRAWRRFELDGVLGIPIAGTDFSDVKDFEDIISVHRDGQTAQLPSLPKNLNPFTLTANVSTPVYWTSLAATNPLYFTRRFQFYPVVSTGFINAHVKVYPVVAPALDWDWEDETFLDRDLLVYATAFMSLIGDDLNAAAASVAKALMESKYKDILKMLASQPLSIRGGESIPMQWYERTV